MMALTSALTATILLLPIAVMAQNVAVITIRARENGTNLYRIGFSEDIFNSFHSCFFSGYATCSVSFSGEGCTDGTSVCSAVFARVLDNEDNGNKPYYRCGVDQSRTVITCQKLDNSQLQGATSIDTYTLQNFHPSKCAGLVWTLPGEGITFVENQLPVEECGNDRSRTNVVTTPQPATLQPDTPQPATPQPATPQPTTYQPDTTQPETPQPTTPASPMSSSPTLSTTINIGFQTTQFSSGSRNSGGAAPVGVLVALVVGVISVVVLS